MNVAVTFHESEKKQHPVRTHQMCYVLLSAAACCYTVHSASVALRAFTMACNGYYRHEDDDEHDNFHHYSDLESEEERKNQYAKCHKKNCIVESVR